MGLSVRVNWHPQKVTRAEQAGAVTGLRKASEHLLGESRKVVPHETGTLQRSGVAQVDEGSLTAAVSYDTPYAVVQHEDMTLAHDAGRTAKYLERPATQQADTLQALIAASIRKALS